MAYDEKQKEYSMKYAKENLKRIPLDVKKDYYDHIIVPEAKKRDMTIRAFILKAIEEKIQRDS